jgi:type I restriction enzyme R subunit
MNEAETRAELIDPKLKEDGWDNKADPNIKIHREYPITLGKIRATGGRDKGIRADYVLAYKNRKLAVIEAKSDELPVSQGVAQAKDYAIRLQLDDTYAANGREIYHIDMDNGGEGLVQRFHGPDELWKKAVPVKNHWQEKLNAVPEETKGGSLDGRVFTRILRWNGPWTRSRKRRIGSC